MSTHAAYVAYLHGPCERAVRQATDIYLTYPCREGCPVLVCTCGWRGDTHRHHFDEDRWRAHRDAALRSAGNACRYCAEPIAEWGAMFCSDSCAKADRRDRDARLAALDAHSLDPDKPTPVPDEQGALW